MGWEQWIWSQVPELNSVTDPIERACCFVAKWNKRIEDTCKDRPYFFHRAEDPFSDDFFEFLGVPKQGVTFKNKTINTMKSREEDFTTDDIPEGKTKEEFLDLIERYKYRTNLLG
jgi:hypothetical protein